MARLIDRFLPARHDIPIVYGPNHQQIRPMLSWSNSGTERVGNEFVSYVRDAYASNGIVWAAILARGLLFSEARFAFRARRNGRPGELFGTPALSVLETPWAGGTTGDLLFRMEQDVSLAGNSYIRRDGDRLFRMRPDRVDIVSSPYNPENPRGEGELLGYAYYSTGRRTDGDFYLADEVAHFAPIPDPLSHQLGMSWLTPVVREIDGDLAMTAHKNKFFEHAAVPSMLIKLPGMLSDKAMERFEKALEQRHYGIDNAYKTMIMEGGADATVVGNSFEQMSFATVQAAGENRILMASGVPGIIVGAKEGLQAATYSNFGQAKRKWLDLNMRPAWRNLAGSVAQIVDVPAGAELWVDTTDIAALREDAAEEAQILLSKAGAIRQLSDGGFTPESIVAAVEANDLTLLQHTGMFSVQLQEPGALTAPPAPPDKPDKVEAKSRPVRKDITRDADGWIASITEVPL